MPNIRDEYDVVVVGAGHAGCEAALAASRMGLETIIFTVSVESIAMMPCNPNIEMCIRDSVSLNRFDKFISKCLRSYV